MAARSVPAPARQARRGCLELAVRDHLPQRRARSAALRGVRRDKLQAGEEEEGVAPDERSAQLADELLLDEARRDVLLQAQPHMRRERSLARDPADEAVQVLAALPKASDHSNADRISSLFAGHVLALSNYDS